MDDSWMMALLLCSSFYRTTKHSVFSIHKNNNILQCNYWLRWKIIRNKCSLHLVLKCRLNDSCISSNLYKRKNICYFLLCIHSSIYWHQLPQFWMLHDNKDFSYELMLHNNLACDNFQWSLDYHYGKLLPPVSDQISRIRIKYHLAIYQF